MNSHPLEQLLLGSLGKVQRWVEEHDYRGYEPSDGLASFLRPLTFRKPLLERLLMQLVWRSPLNLRPLLGIRPLDSAIGRGYMAWGYLWLWKLAREEDYAQKARACLEWLMEHRSPGWEEFCWGKHFDFTSRGGRYPKLEPITVWTSLIGMAFLEGYEILGETRYLSVVGSVCRWIAGLARNSSEKGVCLSYTGSGDSSCTIHNHSMLAAAMLARASRHLSEDADLDLAARVMSYSCSSQLADGSWYYGEEPKYRWIDNFHTGYNLDSLKWYSEATGDRRFQDNLRRGFSFYLNNFFEPDGRPRYYHDRLYPIDSQCVSQAIDTLSNFAEFHPQAMVLAVKVATWAIERMQGKDGHFYYRRYRLVRSRTPMLHWAQATTFKALAFLVHCLRSRGAARSRGTT